MRTPTFKAGTYFTAQTIKFMVNQYLSTIGKIAGAGHRRGGELGTEEGCKAGSSSISGKLPRSSNEFASEEKSSVSQVSQIVTRTAQPSPGSVLYC